MSTLGNLFPAFQLHSTRTVRLELAPDVVTLLHRTFDILEPLMSKLTDAVTALTAAVDAAVARDQALVASLNQQIADLTAQVAAGGLSAAEEDAQADLIAALQAKVDALDPSNPATLPPGDPGTTPPV